VSACEPESTGHAAFIPRCSEQSQGSGHISNRLSWRGGMWTWSAVGPDDPVRIQEGVTRGCAGIIGSELQFIFYRTRMRAKDIGPMYSMTA